jgi:hypothetical protein
LGIESEKALYSHYMRGALFESFVMSEFMKYRFNRSKKSNCYFWRDAQGNEVDCILEYGNNAIPVEIKSGLTVNQNFFDPLIAWQKFSAQEENQESKAAAFVVYGGQESCARKHAKVFGWDSVDTVMIESEKL